MKTLKNFLDEFIHLAEVTIIELEKTKDKPKDKKAHLDMVLTTFANVALAESGLGLVYKFIIRKWIIPLISYFAQKIYDLLTTTFKKAKD